MTRELSAVVADTLRQRHANVETSYRDLAANPIAHLSGEIVGARFAPSPTGPRPSAAKPRSASS
ncbi:FMN-dependent NADH-azoreductase [Chromobacterium violaceum]|uniref:FMN-dependent NADH-azoreductase n=1 Tax=Chromobacterium violaceum TaxID=536 RepID=A0A3S4HHY5_CHRVL|nr:FMN-dependent NADH-azoreductase [Chromobacterium violaceum]